ncbi:DUF6931 family protein [Seohaeicola zhoushanensis]
MSERFSNLTKIPDVPAAKMLADANIRLKTPLDAPASAKASVVLAELDAKDAWVDMLILLGVILPGRERVWWACLAARDYIGPKSDADPLPLTVAETWVFKPNEDNRDPFARRWTMPCQMTIRCIAPARPYSQTALWGRATQRNIPLPGAAALSAYAMNMVALGKLSDKFEQHKTVLIDRALDIARGGNGRIAPKAKEA